MASKNSRRRGPLGMIVSVVVIVLLIGFVIAFARANNISSAGDAWQYLRDKSQTVRDCGAEDVEWNCKPEGGKGGDSSDEKSDGSGDSGEGGESDKGEGGEKSDGDGAADANPASALKSLKVSDEQDASYNRKEWRHWTGGKCDNTREQALKERGEEVKLDSDDCRAVSGKWVDPYTAETFTSSSDLDLDPIIPLAYAASHGGQSWDAATKEKFANDLAQHELVDSSVAQKKKGKGPADWMPDNEGYVCEYSTKWVTTASQYGLSITKDDAKALEKGLATC